MRIINTLQTKGQKMQIDTLTVEMLLKNEKFMSAINTVSSAIQGVSKKTTEMGNAFEQQTEKGVKGFLSLQNAVKGVAATLAAAFVKTGIVQFTEQAAALDRLSQSVRDNVEDLQAFGEAIKREGGSVEGFNGTVKKLNDEINAIPLTGGRSPLLMGLVRLGVNFRNLDGSMKKPLDTLKDLSARFSKMSLVRSLALGKKLGLDEPTIRLLQKGRKGLDELIAKYKDLGVMSAEDVKNGAKLNKVFQDYRQIITFLGMRMAGYFLPIAEKISNWFIKAAKWVKDNERVFKAAITTIGAVITASLIKPILALVSNPVLMGLAALAAAIMLIVEDFMAWKEGADSLLGPLYEWLSKTLPNAFKNLKEIIKDSWQVLKDVNKWIEDHIGWVNLLITALSTLVAVDLARFYSGLSTMTGAMIKVPAALSKMTAGFIASFIKLHPIILSLTAALGALVLGYKTAETVTNWFNERKRKKNNEVANKNTARLANLSDEQKDLIIHKGYSLEEVEKMGSAIQQMASIYDNAPAVASMQTTNRTMNNNDNSKTWRVERVEVNNNFTTPIPQNMQRGVADAFSTPVLQNDIW